MPRTLWATASCERVCVLSAAHVLPNMHDAVLCMVPGAYLRRVLYGLRRIGPNSSTQLCILNRLLSIRCGVFAATTTRGSTEQVQLAVTMPTRHIVSALKKLRGWIGPVTIHISQREHTYCCEMQWDDGKSVSWQCVGIAESYTPKRCVQSVRMRSPGVFIGTYEGLRYGKMGTVSITPNAVHVVTDSASTAHFTVDARTDVSVRNMETSLDHIVSMSYIYEDGDDIILKLPWAVECRTPTATYTFCDRPTGAVCGAVPLPNSPVGTSTFAEFHGDV